MMNSLVWSLAALFTCISYASASPQAGPAAVVHRANSPSPSTVTLPYTIFPTASGIPGSVGTLTITLNPTYNGGPAFTPPPAGQSPEPAVPDDTPPCQSLDGLVNSCTTISGFFTLPLSAQAVCLCEVGPWDSVIGACYDLLTVAGQYYASSLSSHGLLGLCSSYGLGPTTTTVPATTSATTTGTPSPTTETSTQTTTSGTESATGGSTSSSKSSATGTQSVTPVPSPGSGSASFSLARSSLLAWVLSWLLAL